MQLILNSVQRQVPVSYWDALYNYPRVSHTTAELQRFLVALGLQVGSDLLLRAAG